MKFFKAFLAFLALAAFSLPLAAQTDGKDYVKASLVSTNASVQPGTPFTVAVRMEHVDHWHTYWVNPGTGLPTELKWNLPAGWTAGEVQWPTPGKILDDSGAITGNGYDHVTYLQVNLTPPKTLTVDSNVTLNVTVNWLVCNNSVGCYPGEQALTLTLPVSVDPPAPNADVQAELAKLPMPQMSQGFDVSATRTGDKVLLTLTGDGPIKTPHFFSQDAFVAYDVAQTVSEDGKTVKLSLTVAADAKADTQKLLGILAYTNAQGEYRGIALDVPLTAGAAGSSGAADGAAPTNFAMTLLMAFLGGLILNLMPCVFPVLGIKIMGFVNQANSDRRKVTMHGLTFTAGVLLSFWALAAVLAVLRAGGEALGWGFQLQEPGFVFVIAVIMLVFAMSLSGVFEFGVSATGVGGDLQMKDGYAGSFFTGILATIVATPCSAPFLGPALGTAFSLSTAQGFVIFTMVAIGLSAPYLLLSIFPQAVKYLPRPGKWMETFKQFMAFPLYATVALMVWVISGQIDAEGFFATLMGLPIIALGVWVYGRYSVPGNSKGLMRFGVVGGLALLLAGGVYGWPRDRASDWEPWSTARVEELRAEGRPIYVDFTATWCATCLANKGIVFSSEAVNKYFADNKVAKLKADWSKRDPLITAELKKWNRAAIPVNLVYLPGAEPKILPEALTPGRVLEAFSGAKVADEKSNLWMYILGGLVVVAGVGVWALRRRAANNPR